MNQEKNTNEQAKTIDSTESAPDFKGYTLEELQWQRAFVALQAELAKETLIAKKEAIAGLLPFGKSKNDSGGISIPAISGKTLQRIVSSLSYLDYFRMASTVARTGMKIFRFFRRK